MLIHASAKIFSGNITAAIFELDRQMRSDTLPQHGFALFAGEHIIIATPWPRVVTVRESDAWLSPPPLAAARHACERSERWRRGRASRLCAHRRVTGICGQVARVNTSRTECSPSHSAADGIAGH